VKNSKYGHALAVKEHLLGGKPITRLEALIFYGLSNLTDVISELRKSGWIIEKRSVPFAVAVKRVNEFAVLEPPKNLPIREIQLTEYWVSK
jgi:hypothetical protein